MILNKKKAATEAAVGTSATYILHADWLGTARLTTSYTGRSMTYDTAYAPYGESYSSTSTSTAYLDFTGQFQDTMTGLHDFLYREHDPVQGRWTSPDPAGLGAVDPTNPQSWNRYAYVANAPLSATDPSGLSSNSDGSGGSDGCWGGDLGGRFECILPDGLAGPPILAGDGPNPTIPLVVTIVNVNASPGNGAIPEWLWWEFPWVFTPRPPLVNVGRTQICTTALTGIVSCRTVISGANAQKQLMDQLNQYACIAGEMAKSYSGGDFKGDNGVKSGVIVGVTTAVFSRLKDLATGAEAGAVAASLDLGYEYAKASTKCAGH